MTNPWFLGGCLVLLFFRPLVCAKTPAEAMTAGNYRVAIQRAEVALVQNNNRQRQTALQLILAQAHRHLGLYTQALASLEILTDQKLSPKQEIQRLNELSKLYLSQGRYAKTDPLPPAKQALVLARQHNDPVLLAKTLNNWANLMSAEAELEKAEKAYQEGIKQLAPTEPLAGKLMINLARVQLRIDEENAYLHSSTKTAYQKTFDLCEQALHRLQKWPADYQKLNALLALGTLALKLHTVQPGSQTNALAHQTLNQALHLAQQQQYHTGQTLAFGYLGQLYQLHGRHQEAAQLTRNALFHTDNNIKQPYRYRWWRQLGSIYRTQGKSTEAIRAYQHAIRELGPIRTQVATTGYYQNLDSFRTQIAPFYFELADMLLQQATKVSDPSQRTTLQSEARSVIEAYKRTELRDYFKGECLQDKTCLPLDHLLDEHTAILYPIVLPGRLEILLTLPNNKVIQAQVEVSENTLRATTALFLSALRIPSRPRGSEQDTLADQKIECIPPLTLAWSKSLVFLPKKARYTAPAKKLYHWLIAPVHKSLQQAQIDTLVVVPEGILRTIPFAALYNGNTFLIQDFAIATAPSFCIGERQIENWSQAPILAAGLSESVQGFSEIPCAKEEVETVLKITKALRADHSQQLLNKAFVKNKLAAVLRANSYPLIHIASHAQFSPALEDTFLLTYNDRLNLNDLENLLRLGTGQGTAVELLTLSACETAVGNDRAALGLAGVALKAGVKSTLASLWRVDDAATPTVIVEFYRQIRSQEITMAKALQKAQQRMLTDTNFKQYRHPYYWAPFLLLGNWL